MPPLYRSNPTLGFVGKAYGPAGGAASAGNAARRVVGVALAACLLPLAATVGPAAVRSGTSAAQQDLRRTVGCRPVGPCLVRTTVGALVGTAAGTGAGFLVGAVYVGGLIAVQGVGAGDDGGPALLLIGTALTGAALGMPLGGHLGNRRRGSLVLDYLLPVAASAAASWLVVEHANSYGVIIPVTTLGSVVATEVLTAR